MATPRTGSGSHGQDLIQSLRGEHVTLSFGAMLEAEDSTNIPLISCNIEQIE